VSRVLYWRRSATVLLLAVMLCGYIAGAAALAVVYTNGAYYDFEAYSVFAPYHDDPVFALAIRSIIEVYHGILSLSSFSKVTVVKARAETAAVDSGLAVASVFLLFLLLSVMTSVPEMALSIGGHAPPVPILGVLHPNT